MSLGPTFVQAQDGRWFKDPVLRGSDWFICWDEDDPIELVVKDGGTSISKILADLKQLGWHLAVESRGHSGERIFSKCWEFEKAKSYFLKQLSGAPPAGALETEEIHTSRPKREGTYFSRGYNGWGN